MKLLFDQNLSHKLVIALRKEFPGSAHVREVGLASADDLAVWNHAKQFGFTIVSKDADFSQRSFLFGPPPKVIWIKLGNCSTRQVEDVLKHHSPQISVFDSDQESAFLVIDPSLETGLNRDPAVTKSIRIPVDSSVIASISYDPESRTLEIEFKATEATYQYFDVPGPVYEELLTAPSKGAFINSQIKQKYRFKKVL